MDRESFAVALFDDWTALWNGDLGLAERIMAPEFVLRYAQPGTEAMDSVRTPSEFAKLILRWRRMRGDPEFRVEGRPIVQADGDPWAPSGVVVRPYRSTFRLVERSTRVVSGIDMLCFVSGRIVEVLSVSGGVHGRAFDLPDHGAVAEPRRQYG